MFNNIEKKYYWVGLGVVLFIFVAIIAIRFGSSSDFTGNILGTPEEYQTYKTEVETKVTAIETTIENIKSAISTNTTKSTDEKDDLVQRLSAEEARIESVKSVLSQNTEPNRETNEAVYDQLAIVNDVITKLNSLTEILASAAVSCPLTDANSPLHTNAKTYKDYLDDVDTFIKSSTFESTKESNLEDLFIDLLALSNEYEEGSANCFVLDDPDDIEVSLGNTFKELSLNSKVSTINDTIELINDGPIKCARALSCSGFQNLEEIKLNTACPSGTTRNTSTGECTAPPTCPITDAHTKFDIIYGQLQIFTTIPNNFDAAQQAILASNISAAAAFLSAEEAALYSPFLTNFNYSTSANTLINAMNGTITRYTTQNPLCSKDSFATLTISTTANQNTQNTEDDEQDDEDPFDEPVSCPVDSVYFEDDESCVCLDTLAAVDADGSCDETETPEDGAPSDESGTEESEEQITCDDGTVVDDILACFEEDDGTGETETETVTTEDELPNNENDELLGSADDPLSLVSNTDPNVMYSATVQGETGLAPVLLIVFLVLGAFNVFIWLR